MINKKEEVKNSNKDGNNTVNDVVSDISKKLSEKTKEGTIKNDSTPKVKTAPKINLTDLTKEQIQDLQELFANTPRRNSEIEKYNTVQLKTINGKVVVEWGKPFFSYREDPEQRKEVLKTVIPVKFNGENKTVDVLWLEEFMMAEMITCKVLSMDKKEEKKLTGETAYKRNMEGEVTSQLIDMYIKEIKIILEVELPNKEIIKINGIYSN